MTIQSQSPELTAFYKAYLAWIEAGAPRHTAFQRDCGLCGNFGNYLLPLPAHLPPSAWYDRLEELRKQLNAAGQHSHYPFNASPLDYAFESGDRTCHLNPARIQWVRDHAKDTQP